MVEYVLNRIVRVYHHRATVEGSRAAGVVLERGSVARDAALYTLGMLGSFA